MSKPPTLQSLRTELHYSGFVCSLISNILSTCVLLFPLAKNLSWSTVKFSRKCLLLYAHTDAETCNRTLVASIPEIPLKAQVPINIVDINLRDYCTVPEPGLGVNLHSTISSSPRSGSIPQYSDITNPFGYERPTDEIAIVAPPQDTTAQNTATTSSGKYNPHAAYERHLTFTVPHA